MKHRYLQAPAKSLSFPSTPTLVSYPPSFMGSFFPPFPLFISPPSWTKPDHRHAVDVMVAIATDALQQQVCGVTARSREKVTVGHRASCLNVPHACLPYRCKPVWGFTNKTKPTGHTCATALIKWITSQLMSICCSLLGWVMFSTIYGWITCLWLKTAEVEVVVTLLVSYKLLSPPHVTGDAATSVFLPLQDYNYK